MITAFLGIWWVWIAIGLILGLIELFAPSFIFLGFALGAFVTAGFVGLSSAPSVPIMVAVFSVVSLLAWVGLRMAFRRQSSDAKIFTKDVND